MGIKSKRVAFTFDDASLRTLEQMTDEGQYGRLPYCVRESLQITRALSLQAQYGYTELVVRKPGANRERVLVIPRLLVFAEAK